MQIVFLISNKVFTIMDGTIYEFTHDHFCNACLWVKWEFQFALEIMTTWTNYFIKHDIMCPSHLAIHLLFSPSYWPDLVHKLTLQTYTIPSEFGLIIANQQSFKLDRDDRIDSSIHLEGLVCKSLFLSIFQPDILVQYVSILFIDNCNYSMLLSRY